MPHNAPAGHRNKAPMKKGGKRKRLARPAGQGPVTSVKRSGGAEQANAAIEKTKKALKSAPLTKPALKKIDDPIRKGMYRTDI